MTGTTASERARYAAQVRWQTKGVRLLVEPHPCETCGELTKRKRYCSRTCYSARIERSCEGCGLVMQVRPNSDRRFCSLSCAAKTTQNRPETKALVAEAGRAPRPIRILPCPECGVEVVNWSGRGPAAQRCADCRSRVNAAKRSRQWEQRHRIPPKVREAVYLRDRYCQLCFEDVDFTLTDNHPMMASCDHISARMHDGENTLENLQLAHLRCNSARGGRMQAMAA